MRLDRERERLTEIITSKLISQKKTGNWDTGDPEELDLVEYRLGFLRDEHGVFGLEQWQRQRDPFFKDTPRLNQTRIKIAMAPKAGEIPRIILGGWEAAEFNAGLVAIFYDRPIGRERIRPVYSLILPVDDEEVILTNHLAKGFKARLNNINPLNRGGKSERVTLEDLQFASSLIERASVYYWQEKIDQKRIFLPKPSQD